jgi:hypothetical protein
MEFAEQFCQAHTRNTQMRGFNSHVATSRKAFISICPDLSHGALNVENNKERQAGRHRN